MRNWFMVSEIHPRHATGRQRRDLGSGKRETNAVLGLLLRLDALFRLAFTDNAALFARLLLGGGASDGRQPAVRVRRVGRNEVALEADQLGRRARAAAAVADLRDEPHGDLDGRRRHWQARVGARGRQRVARAEARDDGRVARRAHALGAAIVVLEKANKEPPCKNMKNAII